MITSTHNYVLLCLVISVYCDSVQSTLHTYNAYPNNNRIFD